MRLSELVGKEIINLNDGARLGVVGESDVVIEINSGQIESIILPNKGNMFNFWGGEKNQLVIPWQSIKKIGSEVIIVELDDTYPSLKRYSI